MDRLIMPQLSRGMRRSGRAMFSLGQRLNRAQGKNLIMMIRAEMHSLEIAKIKMLIKRKVISLER